MVLRQFERAVDLGTPTDALRRALSASGKVTTIVGATSSAASATVSLTVVADEEALPFADGSLDLVVSALGAAVRQRSARRAHPDPPRAQARRPVARRADRRRELTELREAFAEAESEIEGGVSPRVAPFADLRDLGALLQRAGFALPVADVDG